MLGNEMIRPKATINVYVDSIIFFSDREYRLQRTPCARSLAKRLEFVHTPKHGSWLNIADNELSALTVQCVKGCRFGTIDELREAVMAWTHACNAKQKGVQW